MVQMFPVQIEDKTAIAVSVALPKTNLLVVSTEIGYIMCGALDVQLLNDKLADRKIIAGRAVGVKTIEQLLSAPLESVTAEAETIGIHSGTTGHDAIKIMLEHA
ncbi:DUF1805 domain-containing protein [Fodinisporobacter ferrooxydans]|uniref:DUF1805 domain-containing protein n=1 Tax=Fodinisporobacter ferrooxydans TaxID=2901836 RepID=A0ABY4CJ16_9BACL|nr:DUF1805 domain-containing protein [Alicyclobacillaceae bacterium MYW30-H2]